MSTKLADFFIQFSGKGSAQLGKDVDALKEKSKEGAKDADKLSRTWQQVGSSLQSVAGKVRMAFVSSSLAVGMFTRAALQNTRDGEVLGKTWEYLSRTIGNIFLPYVRGLSNVLVYLGDSFKALDQPTKDMVANIAMGVVAFTGGTAAVLALGAALTALMNPIGLVAVGISAIGVSLFAFSSENASVTDQVATAWATMLKAWDYTKAGLYAGAVFIGQSLKNVLQMAVNVATNWDKAWQWLKRNWWNLLGDMAANAIAIVKTIGSAFADLAVAVARWIASGFRNWTFSFEDQFKKLKESIVRTTEDIPAELKANIVDPAEAAAKAFARATSGIDERFAQNREAAAKAVRPLAGALDGAKAAFGGGFNNKSAPMRSGESSFESFQGTFDRLQKGLAGQDTMAQILAEARKQTEEQKKLNERMEANKALMQKMYTNAARLGA